MDLDLPVFFVAPLRATLDCQEGHATDALRDVEASFEKRVFTNKF